MSNPTASGFVSGAYRQDWLDRHREEVLEPGLPIVDAHHHLYEPPRPRYAFDDLLADVRSGHNIVATVYVEHPTMYKADGPEHLRCVGEVEYVNGWASRSASGMYGDLRICAGIVGGARLDLGVDKTGEALEAMVRAANGRLSGIRHTAHWNDDPKSKQTTAEARPQGLLLDKRFREGVALLAPLGLSYETFIYHPQIGELTDLARAFPGTTIILNHIGAPLNIGAYADKRDEVFKNWGESMRELARCPNVNVKVGGMCGARSGFNFHLAPNPPTSEQLATAWKPYFETVVQAFGPGRCMFESNFPPDKVSYSYVVVWNAFKRLTQGYSAEDRGQMFAGTATRAYRLKLPQRN